MNTQFLIPFAVLFLYIACTSDDTDTPVVEPDISEDDFALPEVFDVFPDNVITYTESAGGIDYVVIETDNIPNHTSPYFDRGHALYEAYSGDNIDFDLNPNRIESQNITLRIPVSPMEATRKEATPLGAIGVSLNGVVFYNQYAGPNNQALTFEINSFDQYLGHPQQRGAYHYHQEPVYLTQTEGDDALLGWLLDGFPVYGPVEDGVRVTNNDLDEYHGHSHSTSEYPEGIYHYHITSEDPYINGSGFFGTPGTVSN